MRAALDVGGCAGLPRYEVLQPEYNLYDRAGFDGPLRDLCMAEEIGVITYYSLAKGFLSGKYRSEDDLGKSARGGGVAGLSQSARHAHPRGPRRGVGARTARKPAEVALAWVIARPGVTAPIASATTLEQVDSLIRAASLKLGADDLPHLTRRARNLQALPVPRRVPAAASPPSAAAAAGSARAASIRSWSQAASVSPISRAMNSSLPRPAGSAAGNAP